MSGRAEFLERVRKAALEGNRPGAIPSLPARGRLAYQGGGTNLVATFCESLRAAGGNAHVVANEAGAAIAILRLLGQRSARSLLLEDSDLAARIPLGERYPIYRVSELKKKTARDVFFAADVGVTNVTYLIAETGSIVMMCRPDDPRSASLLPPVHIAVAHRRQLLPDLFDLFGAAKPVKIPSCLTLITGPSKTGDIELKLVTGVHGPGELHVVLIDS